MSQKYFVCSVDFYLSEWDLCLHKSVTDFQQDFEDFDLANEDDVLEEFLGIERENPKES